MTTPAPGQVLLSAVGALARPYPPLRSATRTVPGCSLQGGDVERSSTRRLSGGAYSFDGTGGPVRKSKSKKTWR